jgi:hypothetical protein
VLGNLKSIQSNAYINYITDNHGTKVILASSSRFVGWMKAFAILDSNPKMPLRFYRPFSFTQCSIVVCKVSMHIKTTSIYQTLYTFQHPLKGSRFESEKEKSLKRERQVLVDLHEHN